VNLNFDVTGFAIKYGIFKNRGQSATAKSTHVATFIA
jgi:hypothetical protein